MEKTDVLVRGVPLPILTMFRGFCSISGKTEEQGIIDIMIQYIQDNSGGDKEHLQNVINEYRSSK